MERLPGRLTVILTPDRMGQRHRERLPAYAEELRTVLVPGKREQLLVAPAVDKVARELEALMAEVEQQDVP
jgi:hypothetical protein